MYLLSGVTMDGDDSAYSRVRSRSASALVDDFVASGRAPPRAAGLAARAEGVP
jgi:hypothetical protein